MDLKKRIEKLEKERQPEVPIRPPNIYEVRELTKEEFEEAYRQATGESR